jgi:hypothetical protein
MSSETPKNAANMMTNDEPRAMISPTKLLPAVQRWSLRFRHIRPLRHRATRRLPKQTMSGEAEKDTIAHLIDEPLAQHMEAVLPAREADFPSLQQMRSQRAPGGPVSTHSDHSPRVKEILSLDIRSQNANIHQMLTHRPRRHIEAQSRTSRPSKAKMKRPDGITCRKHFPDQPKQGTET